ncbi:RRXRR domain-containing protein [Pleurocapsa sp. PCC 7319]|uniref:RRXRR domain-containing protein n=1 Tax=Pleurocapsa sp. PCC 7319 TaxID=118161 RepID=UPI000349E1F3|nr:RRXRR domain-containing protein [Pleurocapsa sp. PCC 7319]
MQRVPVVDKNGSPLMPTKCSRARRMVRDGKAVGKWNKLGVHYIQLVKDPSGREMQSISVGLDPGKFYSGIGLVSSKFTLFTAHVFLPFETVKNRMEQRLMMRRSRRGRRINRKVEFSQRAHRQKRFSNRRQKGVAPSIKANRLLEISIISELSKLYPISSIVYEYVKAKTIKGCSFSPVQVGQKWAIEQLSKIAPVVTKFGWQTSNLRKHLGLPKQKLNKKEPIPATHAVDGLVLAVTQFIDYLPFENSGGRGHCWQGKITITDAPFLVIRRPPISRRQLHLMLPSKGGNRRKYGGTITRHQGIRKGDFVEGVKAGITSQGWCSGDTARQISISNAAWKRIGQFTASKVRLLQRSTKLICTQGKNFTVAV